MLASYTECYCEENVYQFLKQQNDIERFIVVFITNQAKRTPIWCQTASTRPDGVVVWDYHCIAARLQSAHQATAIYDFDTTLPNPCTAHEYITSALPPLPDGVIPRLYRCVPAKLYLDRFASDRSHMLRAGSAADYISPPPHHRCIVSMHGYTNTLPEYVSVPSSGQRYSMAETTEFFFLPWTSEEIEKHPYGVVLDEKTFSQLLLSTLTRVSAHT
jgi:protein N-terminal glutamine amidohydrolase